MPNVNMRFSIHVSLMADLVAIVVAVGKTKAAIEAKSRLKPIDWNEKYYSEPFELCRPAAEMEPCRVTKRSRHNRYKFKRFQEG